MEELSGGIDMIAYPKTLKGKILFYCFSFTVILVFIIVSICLTTFEKLIKLNNIQTINYNLQIAMDNIQTNVSSVMNIAYWSSTNDYITTFFSTSNKHSNNLKSKKLSIYNILKNHIYTLGADAYINKIIIYYDNGNLIQFGSIYGDKTDVELCLSFPYFEELRNCNIIKWIGIFDDPFIKDDSTKAIPIVRNIYMDYKTSPVGWVFISMDTHIITDFISQYDFDKESELYLILGNKTYDISDKETFVETNQEFFLSPQYHFKDYKTAKYVDFTQKNMSYTAVFYTSDELGWTLVQTFPNKRFAFQNKVYIKLLFFITGGILFLVLLIVLIINKMINKPIKKILEQIERISLGDFTYNSSIESEDEFGYIGIGINKMAQNLKKLISQQIENEKTKKDLELRMLQNQINPHFLYNTLNSIKWMAVIQNANGIAEMADSLTVLLKTIATGTDELISIEQEINILNEYCRIQRYRYGGLFTVNYYFEDPLLKKCEIIKFTLQPIVENAIFHGLEPKGSKGIIDIHIKHPSEKLLKIEIKDNGIGMSKEQIEKVMTGNSTKEKSFNNVGIKNVDERIKLTFGKQYGIAINSIVNKYTKVTITLPFKLIKSK